MNRCIVLELTHAPVGRCGEHMWALWCRYRPNILGVVLAHADGVSGPSEWDWATYPIGAGVAA